MKQSYMAKKINLLLLQLIIKCGCQIALSFMLVAKIAAQQLPIYSQSIGNQPAYAEHQCTPAALLYK